MLKVLVVDDESIMRIALSMILNWTEHGYELVGMAADGLQALDAIDMHMPDVVITDLYMPNMDGLELIRKLRERNYAGKIVVLSNYDDFERVREAMKLGAIDYMLKVTLKAEDLITVLEKSREQLSEERQMKEKNINMMIALNEKQLQQRNNFWKDLLLEEDRYIADVVRDGEKLGISSTNIAGQLLFIKIDHYEAALSNGKINNKKLLDFSVANIIKDTVLGRNATEIVDIGSGQYVVMIRLQENHYDQSAWLQSVRHLMEMLNLYLNLSISVALGNPFAGFDELRLQFSRCLQAAASTFYSGPGSIIHGDSAPGHSAFLQSHYLAWSTELQISVEQGDSNRLSLTLDGIIDEAKRIKCDQDALKQTFMLLLTDLEHLIAKWERNAGSPGSGSEDGSYFAVDSHKQQILSVETIDELHACVKHAFQEASKGLLQAKSKQCRKEVLRVIEIMKENLHGKVSLEMLANEVNMNVSYLCRVFKQDLGTSIVQYMNDMKIGHAVELLKLPDVRVKEVAAAIGIDDPFYFNRLFKKSVGVSPSDFRKKLFQSSHS